MRPTPLRAGLALLLLAGAAEAAPTVTVLDLDPGDCLGSGLGVVDGPPPGGEFLAPPVDVPVRVRLANPDGGLLTVVLTVDGQEVDRLVAADADANPFETSLRIPFDAVADGPGRLLAVRATAGGQETVVQVAVDLDRAPPDVQFAEAGLEDQGACFAAEPPALDFQVADGLDPAPQVQLLDEVVGCERRRTVQTVDRCGNGQRVTYITLQAPAVPPVVNLLGVEQGASVPLARVSWSVDTGAGCVVLERGELSRNGGPGELLFAGEPIVEPGDYVARVTVGTCAEGAEVTGSVSFTVTGGAVADPGGPYLVPQGSELMLDASASSAPPGEGAIVEYAWDLDGDGFFTRVEPRGARVPFDTTVDGVFPVGLRITTETGYADFGQTDVVVEDVTPTCSAGGPYTIEQGLPLTVDGSATEAGHPVEPLLVLDWDFGDDRFPQRGLNRRPVHRYLDEGDFQITLTAADRDSEVSCQALVTVLDVQPEIRDLAAVDAEDLVEGGEVRFTAGRTTAGSDAEPLIAFRWDFGDGQTAEGPDLRGTRHLYDDSGEFEVCLQVDDPDSTVEDCITVVVRDLAPVARLDGPGFAREGEAVVFSALGSAAGGPADPLSRYEWDFGDGSPPVVVNDLAQTEVTHVFEDDGPTTVTLRVYDEDSFSQRTLSLFVEDARPQADLIIRAGLTVPEGELITLDGRGSRAGAPSDPIVAYAWEFGDGSTLDGADLAQVTHRWPDQGTFEVRLVVIDSDGSRSSAQRFIEVTNVPPRNLRITGPGVVEVGAEATWRAEYEDAPGDTGRLEWRLGDGRIVNGRSTVSHSYGAPGFYTQRVVVDDGDGGVSRVDRVIQVTVAAPRLEGPEALDGTESEPLRFTVTARPAGQGGDVVDGPLVFRLVAGPDGLRWAPREGAEVDPLVAQPLDFAWTPGPADAGEHRVRVVARAPSGTERAHEVLITVQPQGEAL
ncbi:MAG: PKD domain-containing protein, partial [Myxococcales bacterium]|nr:PKD domain-containing protein [Myxococcales bacterium]